MHRRISVGEVIILSLLMFGIILILQRNAIGSCIERTTLTEQQCRAVVGNDYSEIEYWGNR